ncbi:MAG: hypothetical protein C0398_03400 [Coprothermobacter sp.]|nr:hypothetical protein [Coprothermobacter sp.]
MAQLLVLLWLVQESTACGTPVEDVADQSREEGSKQYPGKGDPQGHEIRKTLPYEVGMGSAELQEQIQEKRHDEEERKRRVETPAT